MFLLLSRIHMYLRNEKGQGMVEYGLILGLITVLAITSLTDIGKAVAGYFATVAGAL